MRIDLHTHSTTSDGTDAPAALMALARDAGLDVIALTDHDTTAGWPSAAAALPAGLTLVPGAELSGRWYGPRRPGPDGGDGAAEPAGNATRPEHTEVVRGSGRGETVFRPDGGRGGRTADGSAPGEGAQAPVGLHLLAYLFDPAYRPLAEELAKVRRSRERRSEKIVALLNADDIDVTVPEVQAYAGGGTVGRPHIAQALVRRGLVGSVDEAFAPEWLGRRYRLPKADIDVFTALRLVREAGGVPVLAHPRAGRRGHIVPDAVIAELAQAGLWGVEAGHPDHTPDDREHVRALARDLGLRVAGSSDYHGANKTIPLGAFTTDPEVYDALIATATGTTPITRC
ncbi:phosphatase [Sphaerisporangium melleum]|uniref:Phosphatase n=1 Tax=Sphaerisporangium melleum TaxID=321316 RepID=A0A917VCK5_9ACTN|nr:PHP domain-containing protein [Sphaerisporangium melleum]GGK62850.1 phosphatase [Sphaerisporangium melleum]GII68012.1 phosphatase [Sphaerisporangium melleum]